MPHNGTRPPKKGEFKMEINNVNVKNWKSLIKPSKIDVDQ